MSTKVIRREQTEGFPSVFTLPVLMVVLALVFCGLFYWYPQFVAHSLGKLLGKLALLDFFDNHQTLLQGLKYSVNGFYVVSSVAILDMVLMLFTYCLLNEIKQLRKGGAGILKAALRGIWLLLTMQLALGILVSAIGVFFPHYTCLYLMPPLFTSSMVGSVVMAVWEVSVIAYAFVFVASRWNLCARSWELISAYKGYWILFLVLAFLTTWALPALLDHIWKGNSRFPAMVYVWLGAGLHTLLLSGMVIGFINLPTVWDKAGSLED